MVPKSKHQIWISSENLSHDYSQYFSWLQVSPFCLWPRNGIQFQDSINSSKLFSSELHDIHSWKHHASDCDRPSYFPQELITLYSLIWELSETELEFMAENASWLLLRKSFQGYEVQQRSGSTVGITTGETATYSLNLHSDFLQKRH